MSAVHRARTLYLHIGCEKTGTTTIQRSLAGSRGMLRAHGVLYPESLGPANHFDLGVHCLDNDRMTPLRRMRGLDDAAKIERNRAEIERKLCEEIAAARPEVVILSNEQLSSNVQSPGEVARLRELLAGVAHTIEVVCYLRRQDEMCLSSYSTEVKAGRTTPFNPRAVSATAPKYNFRTLLELWLGAFSRERLQVRLFDPRFYGEDLLADFACVTGIGKVALQRAGRQNTSLDVHALELLRLMNAHLPKFGDTEPLRGNLQEVMSAISDGPRMALSRADSALVMRKFAEGNRWVLEQFFPQLGYDPFGEVERPERGETAAVSAEKLAEYAARMWQEKQRQFLGLRRDRPQPKP